MSTLDNIALLTRALKLLLRFPDTRCSVAYMKWMLLGGDGSDQKMLAIRDELTELDLIGWSYPPSATAEIFISDRGHSWVCDYLPKPTDEPTNEPTTESEGN